MISGGNFHAEPVAMAADNLALAIAEIGALSERRIALMMDKHMSQLPPFTVKNGGVNSGFMIARSPPRRSPARIKRWRTRTAWIACRPRRIRKIMSQWPRRQGGDREMAANTRGIIAVEWLAACQGIDLREGLTSSPLLEQARQTLREQVAHYTQDRFSRPILSVRRRCWRKARYSVWCRTLCECCRMARRVFGLPNPLAG